LLGGLEDMRRGAESLREQNVLVFDGLVKIALARAEAGAGQAELAIATVDDALATADRLGFRAFQAELHRARGELLLRGEAADLKLVEGAFQAAIAVAREQGARSFELSAALSLAKLYQSTGCAAYAHAVLAPALEDFALTGEMPELQEAQALLLALAETNDVRAEAAKRDRRLSLQLAYGNALIAARGYGAAETT
jgi:predicted ATPase